MAVPPRTLTERPSSAGRPNAPNHVTRDHPSDAPELSPEQFVELRDRIYTHAGLHFDERKRYFVSRRLERRIVECGVDGPEGYLARLRAGGPAAECELQQFVEALTTHETYFFREFPQLQGFADHILHEVLEERRRAGDFRLRLWCAGCSTGEEAYTLAIILREVVEDFARWTVSITATDISHAVLATARRGLYGARAVRDVPPEYLTRHFHAERGGWRVAPEVAAMVQFRQANLMDAEAVRSLGAQDFIFCRNVLIYFDDASRRRIVDRFHAVLTRGGYIFLGHSESVGRITSAFTLVRKGGMLAYMK